MTIKVICAWCGCCLGEKPIPDKAVIKERVSHSICKQCKDKALSQVPSAPIQETKLKEHYKSEKT